MHLDVNSTILSLILRPSWEWPGDEANSPLVSLTVALVVMIDDVCSLMVNLITKERVLPTFQLDAPVLPLSPWEGLEHPVETLLR